MSADRYIIIKVAYEPQLDYGRSLEWIAPELGGAGLTMTEDHTNEPHPWRAWGGMVDGPTFERFVDAYGLDNHTEEPTFGFLAEPEHLVARTRTLDGMNWEAGGESPIIYVSVSVSDVPHEYQCAVDRLAFTHVG